LAEEARVSPFSTKEISSPLGTKCFGERRLGWTNLKVILVNAHKNRVFRGLRPDDVRLRMGLGPEGDKQGGREQKNE
jgi:hypothetical protein